MTKLRLVVQLTVALSVVGGLAVPTHAEDNLDRSMDENLDRPSEQSLPLSSQTLTQTPLVQITNVRLDKTNTGLQVVLETTDSELSTPTTIVSGDALIVEIANAELIGEGFEQFEPAEGIAVIQVSSLLSDRVQVVITGEDAVPTADIGTDATGLTLSIAPGIAQVSEADEPLRIVVTGEENEDYNPLTASTATRTDTPLRDIPQSIQVVPRQVLEDRNVQSISEALETVSGVVESGGFFGVPGINNRIIRGFEQGFTSSSGNLRNGLSDGGYYGLRPIGTVEQIEVLKGPASVLFGALEPGGVINVVTRQPLSDPFYELSFEAGNDSLYEPSVDLTGPLTADNSLLYRLIAGYQVSDGVQDFAEDNLVTVAPSLTWNLSDRTSINAYYEYANATGDPSVSDEAPILSNDDFLPKDFYVGYPELNSLDVETHRFGYTLNHRLNDNWQIRNSFSASFNDFEENRAYPGALVDDRTLTGFSAFDLDYDFTNYFAQIDIVGNFETGSVSHQLVTGFDYNYYDQDYRGFANFTDLPPLDIVNPTYEIAQPELFPFLQFDETAESYGVFVQDQIDFNDSLKLLIGGRYDWVSYENETADFGTLGNTTDEAVQQDDAFSPRIGLVYQPSDTLSLYTSYSRSFRQSTGFNPDGSAFEPTRGTQYEIGIRADLIENRLSANLAGYHLTKTSITTTDPVNTLFSVQTGEARSQGIELDINGEILPGWNIVASYAYTDAEVTEDNSIPEGSRLRNVPENQASLWTTYEIQQGDLAGFGAGLGLFYVGERAGDFTPNSSPFMLDSYLRTDAGLFYRRRGFNAAINVRNLFDIDYATYSFSRNQVARGEPFTIVGSVSWKF
ncbi:MAG: TonB-dependent siderophore receptor [Cyanobacteria bacterium P01_H01_bin.21]